jgi:hypothetical protein
VWTSIGTCFLARNCQTDSRLCAGALSWCTIQTLSHNSGPFLQNPFLHFWWNFNAVILIDGLTEWDTLSHNSSLNIEENDEHCLYFGFWYACFLWVWRVSWFPMHCMLFGFWLVEITTFHCRWPDCLKSLDPQFFLQNVNTNFSFHFLFLFQIFLAQSRCRPFSCWYLWLQFILLFPYVYLIIVLQFSCSDGDHFIPESSV